MGMMREKLKNIQFSKYKDIIIVGVFAIILVFFVWTTFYKDDTSTNTVLTENESKLCEILSKIDGVGQAEVMICEDEDSVKSVVVVCQGANNLQVVMDVREAVCAALGTSEKSVKVYLLKE